MVFDLSSVTDALLGLVKSVWSTAPLWAEFHAGTSDTGPTFTPTFSGAAPDAARKASGPQLSLYLYHAEQDAAREALFFSQAAQPARGATGGVPPVARQPLGLNLFFLLSAFADDYRQEQQAMSIAMRVFHTHPIVRDPATGNAWELTLTMEPRSYDEISRLWQATTVAIRLGAVYRAAVMFIDPDPQPAQAPFPTTLDLALKPTGAAVSPPPPPPANPLKVVVQDFGLPVNTPGGPPGGGT
jgi:hypothetical protein